MSDGGGDGGFGGFGDFGHHDCGHHHHSHDSGFGYYGDVYPDGGSGTPGTVSKNPTLTQRVEAMTGWQKFGAAIGLSAVADGVRRIFSRHKENETQEEAKAVRTQQVLGGAEAIGGGLWVAKVLEDAGKVAARSL